MGFKNDLHFGQVAERLITEQIRARTGLTCAAINTKEADIEVSALIEVKRDRMAKRTGNIAIEITYKGKPSGISTSKAAIWVWEVDGTYWWAYTLDLKKWLAANTDKCELKNGGDKNASELVIIPMFTFVNEIANKINN